MTKCARDQERRAEIEAQCLIDYEAHKHKILLTRFVIGYRSDDSTEVNCDPPARVRVMATTESDILRWNDEWCDPYWDIELVEPHPALEGVRSLYIDGISRSLTGEAGVPRPGWTLDPNQEPAYEPPANDPEPRCPGCGHHSGEGCGCPPMTRTLTTTCPCCRKEITITINIQETPR